MQSQFLMALSFISQNQPNAYSCDVIEVESKDEVSINLLTLLNLKAIKVKLTWHNEDPMEKMFFIKEKEISLLKVKTKQQLSPNL